MNKGKKLMLAVLAMGLLTGCSKFSPDENAVSIGKDGEITAAILDHLDQDYYDAEELKTEVEQAVNTYNQSEGKDCITIEKFQSKDNGEVTLFMKYAGDEDYAAFNHVDFYAGDITDGYNKGGYRFETTFQQIENGKVIRENVDKKEIFRGSNHPMVVFSEEMAVEVPGKILFASSNVQVTGKKSARVGDETAETEAVTESETDTEVPVIAPEEVTVSATSDAEGALAYIIYE